VNVITSLFRLVCLAVFSVTVFGCGGSAVALPHPSDSEARQDLQTIVDLAQRQDWAGLCDHGGQECQTQLSKLHATTTAPKTAPTVLLPVDVPDQTSGNGVAQGGRLLEVCGLDGSGDAYDTRVLFFGHPSDFTVIGALFWTGAGYGGSTTPTQTATTHTVCTTQ
jgi:hypothetical protein